MRRYVLSLDLRDDPAALAYCAHHHVWPEVVNAPGRAGVDRMTMHMLGRRLMMTLEVHGGLDAQRLFDAHAASNQRVHEWERLRRS